MSSSRNPEANPPELQNDRIKLQNEIIGIADFDWRKPEGEGSYRVLASIATSSETEMLNLFQLGQSRFGRFPDIGVRIFQGGLQRVFCIREARAIFTQGSGKFRTRFRVL